MEIDGLEMLAFHDVRKKDYYPKHEKKYGNNFIMASRVFVLLYGV